MADQKVNELPAKASPVTGDKMLVVGAAEESLIDYDQLADAILNKLTSKTFKLDQGTKILVAALNELNSNKIKYSIINFETVHARTQSVAKENANKILAAIFIQNNDIYYLSVTDGVYPSLQIMGEKAVQILYMNKAPVTKRNLSILVAYV